MRTTIRSILTAIILGRDGKTGKVVGVTNAGDRVTVLWSDDSIQKDVSVHELKEIRS